MPRGATGRAVHIRRTDAQEDRTVTLTQSDFSFLRRVTVGNVQIKQDEKLYRRMLALGLVTHRFDKNRDWPIAIADLTAEGRQALAQEQP